MKIFRRILIGVFVLVILAGVFFIGVYVGFERVPEIEKVTGLYNKEEGAVEDVNFAPFWEAWNILGNKYVPENGSTTEKITNQEKVWGAIVGLAGSLGDPHTNFLPPREAEIFHDNISGDFEGVGMEIAMKNNILTVVAPLKASPAEKAGIRAGDSVIKIDGEDVVGINIDESVSMIRGPKGTVVTLTVLRDDLAKPLEIKITRDVIQIPTIETEAKTIDGQEIFIIKIYNFSSALPNLFHEAIIEFADEHDTDLLVIDLRGNPGGFMEVAIEVASWFLPKGKLVVLEKSGEKEKEHRSLGYNFFDSFFPNLKVAILVDRGSASASEILAGALRDHGKAVVVGARTFGKGSVQELVPMHSGGSLKITVARWFTPAGKSISKGGLEPDIEVEFTQEDFEAGRDPQLDKAINYLLSK